MKVRSAGARDGQLHLSKRFYLGKHQWHAWRSSAAQRAQRSAAPRLARQRQGAGELGVELSGDVIQRFNGLGQAVAVGVCRHWQAAIGCGADGAGRRAF